MESSVVGEMTMTRVLALIGVLMLVGMPMSAEAQGKSGKVKGGKGGGPSFCRSGAGHPVFGWEWCRERGWGDGSGTRVASNRTVRRDQSRDAYPDRDRNRRVNDAAFDNGYADGYEKGLDDARDGRNADPTRHKWYRSGDHNYDSQYGSRAQYANVYRDGFRSGYDAGFNDGTRYGNGDSKRWPWPF
jgi:hypothetical protein